MFRGVVLIHTAVTAAVTTAIVAPSTAFIMHLMHGKTSDTIKSLKEQNTDLEQKNSTLKSTVTHLQTEAQRQEAEIRRLDAESKTNASFNSMFKSVVDKVDKYDINIDANGLRVHPKQEPCVIM